MADEFDDELYNVQNDSKEDPYANTDIFGDDYQGTSDNAEQNDSADNYDPGQMSDRNNNDYTQNQNNQPYGMQMNDQMRRQLQFMMYYQQQQMQQMMMQQQQQQQQPHQQRHHQQQQEEGDDNASNDGSQGLPPVESSANQDEGKMFIGGLNWETTDETLRDYFGKFGEVSGCTVMREPSTGRSRGFGFLTMADPDVIDTIVSQDHYLDGKRIDPKRAIPRDEQDKTEKIFVGGIAPEVDEDEFRDYFMQFGKVIDATLMTDRDTGRPRGFGFITFKDSSGVDEALRCPNLQIRDKPIEVKRAEPKSKQGRQGQGQGQGQQTMMMYDPSRRGGYGGGPRYFPGGAMGRGSGFPMYGNNMYGFGNMYVPFNNMAAYYNRYANNPRMGGYGQEGNNYRENNDSRQRHSNDAGRGRGQNDEEDHRSNRGGDRRYHRDPRDRSSDYRSSGRSNYNQGQANYGNTNGGPVHASQNSRKHHYRPY